MKRIVAICLCLVISSVCRAQVGYQGQSAISLGVAKTNYGVMADLRFMNQVTPRSAIGGEVVYNRVFYGHYNRNLLPYHHNELSSSVFSIDDETKDLPRSNPSIGLDRKSVV